MLHYIILLYTNICQQFCMIRGEGACGIAFNRHMQVGLQNTLLHYRYSIYTMSYVYDTILPV